MEGGGCELWAVADGEDLLALGCRKKCLWQRYGQGTMREMMEKDTTEIAGEVVYDSGWLREGWLRERTSATLIYEHSYFD